MRVNITSGNISENTIYIVIGATINDYITYNSVDYFNSQTFVGTTTSTYTSNGTVYVYEDTIFKNSGIEISIPIIYNEQTIYKNTGIETNLIHYPETTIYNNCGIEIGKEILYFLNNSQTVESIVQQGNYFLNKGEYQISISETNEKYAYIVSKLGVPPYTWEQLTNIQDVTCEFYNNDINSNNIISFSFEVGTDNEVKVITFHN